MLVKKQHFIVKIYKKKYNIKIKMYFKNQNGSNVEMFSMPSETKYPAGLLILLLLIIFGVFLYKKYR